MAFRLSLEGRVMLVLTWPLMGIFFISRGPVFTRRRRMQVYSRTGIVTVCLTKPLFIDGGIYTTTMGKQENIFDIP